MQKCLSEKCFSDITLTFYNNKEDDIPVAKIKSSKSLLCNIEYFKRRLKFEYEHPETKHKKGILKLILKDEKNDFDIKHIETFFEIFHQLFDPQNYEFDENRYKTMHQVRFDIIVEKIRDNESILIEMIKLSNYYQCQSLQNLYVEIYMKTKSIPTLKKLLYIEQLDFQLNTQRYFQFKNLFLMLFLREAVINDSQYKKLFNYLNFQAFSNPLFTADKIVSSSLFWFFDIESELKMFLDIDNEYDFLKNLQSLKSSDAHGTHEKIDMNSKCYFSDSAAWIDAYEPKNKAYLSEDTQISENMYIDIRFNRKKILCELDHEIFRPRPDFYMTLMEGLYVVEEDQIEEMDIIEKQEYRDSNSMKLDKTDKNSESNCLSSDKEFNSKKNKISKKRKMGEKKTFSNKYYIASFGGNMNISSNAIHFKKHLKIIQKQDSRRNILSFEFDDFVNVDWTMKFVCHKDCASYTTMSKENLKILESELHYKYHRKHYMYFEIVKMEGMDTKIECESQFKDFISFEEYRTSRNGKPTKLTISIEFSKKIDNNLFNCLFIFKNNDKQEVIDR